MQIDQNTLKTDLLSMSERDFYIKHILKSRNWYFSHYKKLEGEKFVDEIDKFREIVSSTLKVGFLSVKIVGSAKIGFSLSPEHVLRPFEISPQAENVSDIDIAIISAKMFEELWDKIRRTREMYRFCNKIYYQNTAQSIYKGFINESVMHKFSGLEQWWQETMSPVTQKLQDKMSIEHPISYRIYRSWEDIEEYQIHSIYKSRKELERLNHV